MRVTPSSGHARMSSRLSFDQAEPRRRREVDHELGAVGREHVLAEQHRRRPSTSRGDPLAAQHRRADRHLEQLGVGGARPRRPPIVWVAPPSGDGEQLVERARARRRPATARRRARSGHHTVTRANGSPSARLTRRTRSTVLDAEHLAHVRGGASRSAKSRIRRSDAMPDAGELASIVPSRPSVWRSGSPATNQPKPCRASTRPSSRSTSSARRIVTRLARRTLRTARPRSAAAARPRTRRPRPGAAGRRRSPGSGSSRTCLILVYISVAGASRHRPTT